MRLEDLNRFITRTGKSKSTIIRFYKKNPELALEIKTEKKRKKKLYPIEHAKYFDSEIMFSQNKVLLAENLSMKRLIDDLKSKNEMHNWLWSQDWDFFGTIAYSAERNSISCYKQMKELFDSLEGFIDGRCKLKFFFTTEAFANRHGFHNHFTLHVSDERHKESVRHFLQNYFKFDRVQIEPFNRYRPAFGYILKDGLKGETWDFFTGTNISKNVA